MSKKTKIWVPLIIVNIVLATVLILFLVPISSYGIRDFIGYKYYWPPEPGYMASWERELNEGEINYLVQWLGDQFYPHPVLYLAHHGDEPLVIDALLLATEDDDVIRSIGAEVALFKIGIDKEERWAYILNLLRTGGLEEDELYILDLDILDPNFLDTPGFDRDKNFNAGVILHHLRFVLAWALDPVEDADRIPDLLELLDSEHNETRRCGVSILIRFINNQEVISALRNIAESDPDYHLQLIAQEYLGYAGKPHPTYGDLVVKNRNGFKLSMGLILLIAAGSVGYGIHLSRKPNR